MDFFFLLFLKTKLRYTVTKCRSLDRTGYAFDKSSHSALVLIFHDIEVQQTGYIHYFFFFSLSEEAHPVANKTKHLFVKQNKNKTKPNVCV